MGCTLRLFRQHKSEKGCPFQATPLKLVEAAGVEY